MTKPEPVVAVDPKEESQYVGTGGVSDLELVAEDFHNHSKNIFPQATTKAHLGGVFRSLIEARNQGILDDEAKKVMSLEWLFSRLAPDLDQSSKDWLQERFVPDPELGWRVQTKQGARSFSNPFTTKETDCCSLL